MNIAPTSMIAPAAVRVMSTYSPDFKAIGANDVKIIERSDGVLSVAANFATPKDAHLAATILRSSISVKPVVNGDQTDVNVFYGPQVRCMMPNPTHDAIMGALGHLPNVVSAVDGIAPNDARMITVFAESPSAADHLRSVIQPSILGQQVLVQSMPPITTDV